MRTTLALFVIALLTGTICFGADGVKVTPKQDEKDRSQIRTKTGPEANINPTGKVPVIRPVPETRSPDDEAIRRTNASFVKAYEQGDAKAVALCFTADAEYVDELGNIFQGREAIEKSLKAFFVDNPKCNLKMNVDTIRFISPGVAVEDGSTTITRSGNPESIDSRYTTLHVKTDGIWLAASVRDHAPKDRKQHRAQLQQLDWLMGDWVDEGNDAIVNFSCQPVEKGNFLLRSFTILISGQEAMSGTRRIGWDPITGKLRAWIFDSEGGYSEGFWHRDGKNWALKSTGVTPDGQTASSTSIYKFVNEHTMTWQSVDHEIAGVQQPDSAVFTIVRQSPVPSPGIAADQK